jgi:hypothetical protein
LFCRRNLNPNQIAYLKGKRYETEKKIWGGDRGNQYTNEATYQNDKLAKRPQTNENLMVGTISPKYQFDNSGKSPKTNK